MKIGKAINVLKHYYNLDFVVETRFFPFNKLPGGAYDAS